MALLGQAVKEKREIMKKAGHIFLIGFMGCGKSTIASAFSDMTGRRKVEMDQEIVKSQGMEIAEIFKTRGEAYFRDIETEFIRMLREEEPAMVSCGGGAVLRRENVELMKEMGTVIWLTASPETIFGRVRHSKERPILNGNMNVNYIEELMEARRPRYEAAADFIVATDGKTAKEICEEIGKLSV